MQQELDALDLPTPVQIVGVNQSGYEVDDYDAGICGGRDIPFLEEGATDGVWASWRVRYRDVVILDEENRVIGVYNLSDNNLAEAGKYTELRDYLIEQGGGIPPTGTGGAGGAGGAGGT